MGEWSIPPQWYKYNLPPTWIILEFVPPSFRGCYTLAYHYLWCCHVPNFIHPRTLNIGSGSPAMFAFGISGPLKNITSGQKGHNLVQVHCLFTLAWLLAYNTLPTYRISIAWFKGKSTGNHGFTHKKRVSDLRLTRILGLVKSHEVAIFIRFFHSNPPFLAAEIAIFFPPAWKRALAFLEGSGTSVQVNKRSAPSWSARRRTNQQSPVCFSWKMTCRGVKIPESCGFLRVNFLVSHPSESKHEGLMTTTQDGNIWIHYGLYSMVDIRWFI